LFRLKKKDHTPKPNIKSPRKIAVKALEKRQALPPKPKKLPSKAKRQGRFPPKIEGTMT
jgi:hypothetical protein